MILVYDIHTVTSSVILGLIRIFPYLFIAFLLLCGYLLAYRIMIMWFEINRDAEIVRQGKRCLK